MTLLNPYMGFAIFITKPIYARANLYSQIDSFVAKMISLCLQFFSLFIYLCLFMFVYLFVYLRLFINK